MPHHDPFLTAPRNSILELSNPCNLHLPIVDQALHNMVSCGTVC